MSFIENMKQLAKKDIKTIVLPESEDLRVLEATEKIIKEGFAKVILIGDMNNVLADDLYNGIDFTGFTFINPKNPENAQKSEEYINALYELRKEKGMTIDEARDLILNNSRYYASMMVKMGDADGFVSGACHSTADTLRPALQIIKTAPDTKLVSAFFIMVLPDKEFGEDGVMLYSDCGLNENPNQEQLSEIAISSAKTFKELVGVEPKVAMLSYSTNGSAHSELTEKVINATNLVKEKNPELICDGEIQLDAAIIPEIATAKFPNGNTKGKSNILIFPDLNAGNIGYKLTQRFGHAEAYGPLLQGIAKPVNDLSRGCTSDDIVGVVAITAVQAQK